MDTSRFARTVALATFLGTASLVGGAAFESFGPEEAEAGYEVDESYFYTSLAAHGSWVHNGSFGWVWYPRHRPLGWRPYTVGHWSYIDGGDWLWVSAEPYGWATYHYGRWYLDPFYGWVWIPGRVWAPAWVSWRDYDDYIGWAPLGPWGYWDSRYHRYRGWNRYDRWHHSHRHHGHHDRGDWDRGDWDRDGRGRDGRDYMRVRHDDRDSWNFTRKRDFAGKRVDKVLVSRDRTPGLYDRSRPLPPPSEADERAGRGITRAVDRRAIERASGRTIRPVRLEEDKAPSMRSGASPGTRNDPGSDRVRVFRPSVKDKPGAKTPDQLGIAKAPNRGGRSDDREVRGGGRGDDNRGGQPRADRGIDTGGSERAARPDERGGYERPARPDERGGYERPSVAKQPASGRQPSSDERGGSRGSFDRGSQAKRDQLDTQPRGHPRPYFGQSPATGSSRRNSDDAPAVDQRRLEKPSVHSTPASRVSVQPRAASPGAGRGGSPPRQSYSGSAPARPPAGSGRVSSPPRHSYSGSAPAQPSVGSGRSSSPPRPSYSGVQRSSSPPRQSFSDGGGAPRGSSSSGGGSRGYSGGNSHGGGRSSYSGGGHSGGGSSRGGGSSGYSGGGGGRGMGR